MVGLASRTDLRSVEPSGTKADEHKVRMVDY